MKKILELLKRLKKTLSYDIWIRDLNKFPKKQRSILKVLKVLMIAFNDFFKDRCMLRASALTYSFLLAIVPFVAVVLSSLKGFGFSETFVLTFLRRIIINDDVVQAILNFTQNASVKALGVMGGFLLFFTSVSLLTNIEKSFNDIWGIKERRSFFRRFVDYLFAIIVGPIFLSVGIAFTSSIAQKIEVAGFISKFFYVMTPYLTLWIGLTLLYIFLTNTKVKLVPALIAGIVAGTLWQVGQEFYFYLIANQMTRYEVIFQGFATVIFAFIWIYINWLVVLFGVELSFAIQNFRSYQPEGKSGNISMALKKKLGLIVLHLIYRRFRKGEPPLTPEEIISITKGPIKLINELLFSYVNMGLLVENHNEKIISYVPGQDPQRVTVPFVLKTMDGYGTDNIVLENDKDYKKIDVLLAKLEKDLEKSNKKYKIADL